MGFDITTKVKVIIIMHLTISSSFTNGVYLCSRICITGRCTNGIQIKLVLGTFTLIEIIGMNYEAKISKINTMNNIGIGAC